MAKTYKIEIEGKKYLATKIENEKLGKQIAKLTDIGAFKGAKLFALTKKKKSNKKKQSKISSIVFFSETSLAKIFTKMNISLTDKEKEAFIQNAIAIDNEKFTEKYGNTLIPENAVYAYFMKKNPEVAERFVKELIAYRKTL